MFERPERINLSISLNNHTLTDELQIEVVDPISIYNTSPRAIFGGSNVVIKGINLIPGKMNCKIGGLDGLVIMSNESDVICRSPINADTNAASEVVLSFKGAPQMNIAAGIVEVLPTPRVEQMTPSSGAAQGGTNVIIRGVNFRAIGNPWCYFGDSMIMAYILTNKSISCATPESEAGKVLFQLSLDDGNTIIGEQFFSFFAPIILHEVNPRIVISGSAIIIRGEGFGLDLPIQCEFGGTSFVSAKVLSLTEATCVFVPATERFGRVSVSIVTSDRIAASVGGHDISIIHQPLVEISSAAPLYSAIGGETSVTLQIFGLLNVANEGFGPIHCRFGNDKHNIALATIFNESLVACMAPAAYTPGNVSLSLSFDRLPFSSNSLTFEYTAQPKVYGFSPSNGPHSGGTSVRVEGLNLMPRSKVSCRFGHHESYGYLDTNEHFGVIYCVTPAINTITSQTLYLKLDPVNEWIDTGMDFHFIEPMLLDSISPLNIDYGTNYVQVKVGGFSRGVDTMCCFGTGTNHVTTEAVVLSNRTLKCPLPRDAIKDLGPQIPFSISTNGIDYVGSEVHLTYMKEVATASELVMTYNRVQ